jgi:hypothetical protein
VTLGDVGGLVVEPVLAPARLLGTQSGGLVKGATMPCGQWSARPVRKLLASGFALQPQQSLLLA